MQRRLKFEPRVPPFHSVNIDKNQSLYNGNLELEESIEGFWDALFALLSSVKWDPVTDIMKRIRFVLLPVYIIKWRQVRFQKNQRKLPRPKASPSTSNSH